jgi:structural maintenance of chromosome 2
LDDLLVKHKWIEGDRDYFGKPNGMYDFNLNDPHEAAKTVKRLNEYREKMGRNVNSKALDMLGTQEEQVSLS